MDRRDFIRQALITALASGPLQTVSRSGAAWASDEPVCGLPGGYCYGLYDNFDGEGGLNPDTGEHLAREGEFAPALWKFYLSNSEVVHMDDLSGSGKARPIPVDHDGIPVSVYQDPALAMITKYLVRERPGEDRLYDITPLLDGVTLSVLHGESDPRSMVEQLLAQNAIFSTEGEVAAQYFRTGDLWLLHGMSSWTLEAIQKVRRLSGYSLGQGPRRVRYLERDHGGQDREAGSIALVPKDQVERDLAQSKRSKEDRVLHMPRRVTGRRVPTGVRPSPSGFVVKMENTTGVDMRLELVNPSKIEFADFYSWSADIMLSSETPRHDTGIALDYHTSGIHGTASWYCQIGLRDKVDVDETRYLYAMWKNINTGEIEYKSFMNADLDAWYNLRMDIVPTSNNSNLASNLLRLVFYLNGVQVYEFFPPDSDLLFDPEVTVFGPIRSFASGNNAVAYIDNIRAAYKMPQT